MKWTQRMMTYLPRNPILLLRECSQVTHPASRCQRWNNMAGTTDIDWTDASDALQTEYTSLRVLVSVRKRSSHQLAVETW